MQEPVYVTKVAERKSFYPERRVTLPFPEPPQIWNKDYLKWRKLNGWRIDYSVHKNNLEEAKRLADRLWKLQKNKNPKEEKEIIKQLKKIRAKPWKKRTNLEEWVHMAVQMPTDIGGPNKEKIKQFLTERARGRVLESMCGFNSYFGEASNISEVVVLDYCREMLERYPYPHRKRILYDLERVVNGETINFFPDESFQTVGCFGSNYLSDVVPVFREFGRILSTDGKLLIVESTTEGYRNLIKRHFKPEECVGFMEAAALSPRVEYLPIKEDYESGEYYLVEGRKK